ncbi:MAG: hypothetical protein RMH75_04475 [Archaeoglobaceae archaeon]|nr:hypothetical protein [Archaeoglobaceae archaeon]MDW7989903.1 hypothetical protein [Archaeoglobaceae archaeon]
MGFDSVAVAIMLSAVVLAIGYLLIVGNSILAEQAMESYKEITHSAVKRLQSNVEIISASYGNGKIVIFFKNVGATKFKNFESFDIIVYGNSFVSDYLRGNFVIVKELTNPEIFDPQETAMVEIDFQLPRGNYTLLICTTNAVCDSFEFYVEGG